MSSEQPKVVRRREVQSSVAIIKPSNHHFIFALCTIVSDKHIGLWEREKLMLGGVVISGW